MNKIYEKELNHNCLKPFEREFRYIVLKRRDVMLALSKAERNELAKLCKKVDEYRAKIGKPPLVCVVAESDWPEYEATWESIEKRVLHELDDLLGSGA